MNEYDRNIVSLLLKLFNNNRTGSADETNGSDSSDSSSSFSFARVSDSDDKTLAATKVGIPKFTGQETDISDNAKDWI